MVKKFNEIHKCQDLEARMVNFAEDIKEFTKYLQAHETYFSDIGQLIHLAVLGGNNYIIACHAQSQKEFNQQIKLAQKNIKECIYWLELINKKEDRKIRLIQEAEDLIQAMLKTKLEK